MIFQWSHRCSYEMYGSTFAQRVDADDGIYQV